MADSTDGDTDQPPGTRLRIATPAVPAKVEAPNSEQPEAGNYSATSEPILAGQSPVHQKQGGCAEIGFLSYPDFGIGSGGFGGAGNGIAADLTYDTSLP